MAHVLVSQSAHKHQSMLSKWKGFEFRTELIILTNTTNFVISLTIHTTEGYIINGNSAELSSRQVIGRMFM